MKKKGKYLGEILVSKGFITDDELQTVIQEQLKNKKFLGEMLIEKGYEQVYNLQHGIMEWELQELPVIIDPDARPDTDNKIEPKQYYEAINSESLVFIDFYAPWCGPCRKMMPMIDSLKVEYHKDINILKVNVDASKKLVKELKIGGVPYLVLFSNGEIVFSKNGSVTRSKLTGLFDLNLKKHGKSLAELKKD